MGCASRHGSPAKRACAALACAALFPAWAERESFQIDPAHTRPQFEVSHLGISTQRGRFDRTTGSAWLDRGEGAGAAEIEIDAGSASTGDAKLDKALLGEDFLDVAHHPRITFRAERIVFDHGVPVKAQGTLTLLGKARPVDLEIRGFACTRKPFLVRTTCGADAVATISRSAFGMASFAGFIGDEVRLVIQVEAVKEESSVSPTTSQPGG